MKKLILILLIFVFACMPAYAEENDNIYHSKVTEFTEEYGVDFAKLKEYPFETIWDTAKEAVTDKIKSPLKLFAKITSVLLLTSFINFFASDQHKLLISTINTVTMIVLFTNMSDSFMLMCSNIISGLSDVRNFMTAFLPVFAGVSFASGEMITSTVYTGFFMICVVTVADFCMKYIIPSVNLFMALGITSSISPVINLKPFCTLYSKAVKIGMTASVSVLCFFLTLQTTITQSQDSMALKTGKFIVNSAVPIIGSALQSAVGSIYSSMGVLKGFFGVAGILVIINMFLPAVTSLALNWIGYYFMIALSEILENETATDILTVFKETTEILLSMSVLFMILLVFSITVMIKITQGV